MTGLQHASAIGLVRVATGHAGLGMGSCVVLVFLAFLRYSARASGDDSPKVFPIGWMVLQIVAAILISATAITGHKLFG
jgi:hypothetical protein